MQKRFDTAKEYKAYIDSRHRARWKTTLAKLTTFQAELAKARAKFPAAPPAELSTGQAQAFRKLQDESIKVFGYCDRYLARVKRECDEISSMYKKMCE
ncbi:MAG: hypothetical protein IT168_08375 [Bryobacterales bacterium]|nr:hypothetical protein [Bryobacterales bacterium]